MKITIPLTLFWKQSSHTWEFKSLAFKLCHSDNVCILCCSFVLLLSLWPMADTIDTLKNNLPQNYLIQEYMIYWHICCFYCGYFIFMSIKHIVSYLFHLFSQFLHTFPLMFRQMFILSITAVTRWARRTWRTLVSIVMFLVLSHSLISKKIHGERFICKTCQT